LSGNTNSGRSLTAERRAILERCVLDGWPIRQIIETYGFGTRTVKKHYPEYRGITAQESGNLSMATQRVNRKVEHR
jgi:transposase